MLLDGIGIAGYRSFGNEMQYIRDLSKVNIIIGKNNSGKSNILRFIEIISKIPNSDRVKIPLQFNSISDLHKGNTTCDKIQFSIQIIRTSARTGTLYNHIFTTYYEVLDFESSFPDWQKDLWLPYDALPGPILNSNDIAQQLEGTLDDRESNELAGRLLGYTGGSQTGRCSDLAVKFDILNQIQLPVFVVPAYRRITNDNAEWQLQGLGLIKKLNQLKEPLIGGEAERVKFYQIASFVREILADPTAKLDIPHTVDDIYVEMDGRRLSIESLGTGIHQVILLAAAVTLLENSLVCIEELEIYLHPELQKKFIKYICENTNNQYLITTHSNAVFDTADVNIYHCWLEEGQTKCELALSASQKNLILDSLGYKASDILQSNCIIWVEGPSDRIYINSWIRSKAPTLKEGIHYSIMFYGGRLLSHLSGDDTEISEFIVLRKMNRHVAIVIDSDKKNKQAPINNTKKRIQEEFCSKGGFCWITRGREIENYFSEETFTEALKAVHGSEASLVSYGQYDDITKYLKGTKEQVKEHNIDKIKVSKQLSTTSQTLNILDLEQKINELVEFIKTSNGMT